MRPLQWIEKFSASKNGSIFFEFLLILILVWYNLIVALNSYSFDFNRIVVPIIDSHIQRSEAVCRYSSVQQALKSVACDCFGDQQGCFDNQDAVPGNFLFYCVFNTLT